MRKVRWLTRSGLGAAVAALGVVAFTPVAYAGEVRLQAESGTIVNTGCGDDGPAASQSGGTGTVVFLPGDGCQIEFSNSAGHTVDSITFFITGQAQTMCGNFIATGSITGTSDTLCIDGTDSGATQETVGFTTARTGSGSTFTIEWNVTVGASYDNAYVDYLTWSDLEAESGTVAACTEGLEVAGTQSEGAKTVVFLPKDTCSITFLALPGGMVPTGINFKTTGTSGTLCGHFTFSGAYTGNSSSYCNGTAAYSTVAYSASTGSGSTFTVTWHTDSGTPTYVNAYVDYLTYA